MLADELTLAMVTDKRMLNDELALEIWLE